MPGNEAIAVYGTRNFSGQSQQGKTCQINQQL